MYTTTHCFHFRDTGRGVVYSVTIECTADTLSAAGTIDDKHERAGAWIATALEGRDLDALYETRLTVERLASIVFHSLRDFVPQLSAVTVENLGEEFGRLVPTPRGTPDKTLATYRDGPAISDMLKLRSALATLGYNPHEQL
jgi:hypothetical protein